MVIYITKVVMDDRKKITLVSEDCEHLNERTRVIMDSVIRWFNEHHAERDIMLRILQRREQFSLRLIDWMVTNYSKRVRLVVPFHDGLLDVHDDYHRFLSVFNKRLFDPFARRQRLKRQRLRVDPAQIATTTVGQLNFLKWFLERKLDQVILQHKKDIEQDMKRYSETREKNTGVIPRHNENNSYMLSF